MHVAFNAWFWDRPDTGSGQYTRQLVKSLKTISPDIIISLIAPASWTIDAVPDGVNVHHVPLQERGHRAKVRFEQAVFPKAAAELCADLIHVPYWGSPLRSPIPVVVTIHDLIPLLLPQYRGGILTRLYTGLVAATAKGASAVITDSEASRQDILNHLNLSSSQVTAIPLAVDEKFQPQTDKAVEAAVRQQYDLPPEFVLYLGGYDVRKNIRRLLEAFTYVRQGSDIPLVLAGKPPQKRTKRFFDVQAIIGELNLENDTQIIGWIEEDHKPALYRMASCFVFPSRYEGFGLPLLEAMTCGTPVVACDVSSIPEVVGDAGFLVEPDDVRHLAGGILGLLTQEELADKMRQKGLAQAQSFAWTQTVKKTLEVYHQVLVPPA